MHSSRPARRSRSDPAARHSPLPVQVPTSSELAAVFVREQARIRQILHQGNRPVLLIILFYAAPETHKSRSTCRVVVVFHDFFSVENI